MVPDRVASLSDRFDRRDAAGLALAVAGAVLAFLVATRVFPYYSINHDEGVYLQQAQLLLDGQVFMYPPVEDAFRPWFFVEDGDRLYPKYAPVAAAVFALGRLAGDFHLALAGVAAANVLLTYALGRELFDSRVGLLAGLLLLASPLFVIQSALFLPYAPTTAFDLLFAFAYVRAERERRADWATLAGAAIGIAFFARPYTAVLFAAPFVAHACWTLWTEWGREVVGASDGRETAFGAAALRDGLFRRRLATAALGTAGVGVALAYNWYATGHPLLFPYQAFAPLDGVGFGYRRILGYDRYYSVPLALRANAEVVWRLFTQWVVAGPLGTAAATIGVALALRGRDWRHTVLAGTYVSVVGGNVAFWGNLNILGGLAARTDGLIYYLGPYYHFDLLVPTAIFGAYGVVVVVGIVRDRAVDALGAPRGRRVAAALLVLCATVGGGVAVATAADPVTRNDRVSRQLAQGYEPFAETDLENALVYLPTPYGPWLNHPFQELRNDPQFGGDAVYALDREHRFRVAETFPDRTLYRYVYRGSWVPTDDVPVEPRLREIRLVRGEGIVARASFGVPDYADRVSIRVATDRGHAYYLVNGTPRTLEVTVRVAGERVRVTGPNVTLRGDDPLTIGRHDEVDLAAYVTTGPAMGFSYRLELPVDREGGTVRALSPYLEYCTHPRRCGGAAASIGEAPEGVFVRARVANATSGRLPRMGTRPAQSGLVRAAEGSGSLVSGSTKG